MWYNVWIPRTSRHIGGYYQWQHCELRLEGDAVQVFMNKEWRRGSMYSVFARTPDDLLRVATESHAEYIEWHLQPKMRELNRYCINQQWRIDTWHKKPLIPIKDEY